MPGTVANTFIFLFHPQNDSVKYLLLFPILQIRKQIPRELKLICPGSTILQVAEPILVSDTFALNFHTSLLHYPIFNVSIGQVPLLEVAYMLFCSVQQQQQKTPNHTYTAQHRGIITKTVYRASLFLESTIML